MLTIVIIRPGEPLTRLLVALACSMLIFQAFDVIDLWFPVKVKSRSVVIAKNGAFLCSTAVKVALILGRAPLLAFALANALEIVFVAGADGCLPPRWAVHVTLANKDIAGSGNSCRRASPWSSPDRLHGLPAGGPGTAGADGRRRRGGNLRGCRACGPVWYFIPTAVVSSVFPTIIKARECDEDEFYRRLQELTT